MIVLSDENKLQGSGQRGASDNKRHRGAALSPVPNWKDLPAIDFCNRQLGVASAENV